MKVTSTVSWRLLILVGYLVVPNNFCQGQRSTNTTKAPTLTVPPSVAVLTADILSSQYGAAPADAQSRNLNLGSDCFDDSDCDYGSCSDDYTCTYGGFPPYTLYSVAFDAFEKPCPNARTTVTLSCGGSPFAAALLDASEGATCRRVNTSTLKCTSNTFEYGLVRLTCVYGYSLTASLPSNTIKGCNRKLASQGRVQFLSLFHYCAQPNGRLRASESTRCGGGGFVAYASNGDPYCASTSNGKCQAGGTSTKCPISVGSVSVSNSVTCILYDTYVFPSVRV